MRAEQHDSRGRQNGSAAQERSPAEGRRSVGIARDAHRSVLKIFTHCKLSQRFMNSGLPRISGARRFVGDASTALAVAGEKYSPSVAASCAGSGGVILGPCFPGSKLIFTLPPPRVTAGGCGRISPPPLPPSASSSNGGFSSGRLPEPSAVAKLSRIIIASGFSHMSCVLA